MYTNIIELLLKVISCGIISCGSSETVGSKVETVEVVKSDARSIAKKASRQVDLKSALS